jgi:hypothetical protein
MAQIRGRMMQVSAGMLSPMTRLRGDDSDRPDNVLKEILIMQVRHSASVRRATD